MLPAAPRQHFDWVIGQLPQSVTALPLPLPLPVPALPLPVPLPAVPLVLPLPPPLLAPLPEPLLAPLPASGDVLAGGVVLLPHPVARAAPTIVATDAMQNTRPLFMKSLLC
jgi:hypothetical protein